MSELLRKYEQQKLDKYRDMLLQQTIESSTLIFWSGVLTDHILSWDTNKMTEEQKKKVLEIKEAAKHIISYNAVKENERVYLITELNERTRDYNKECLKRKELEKTVKALQNEVRHYESK